MEKSSGKDTIQKTFPIPVDLDADLILYVALKHQRGDKTTQKKVIADALRRFLVQESAILVEYKRVQRTMVYSKSDKYFS